MILTTNTTCYGDFPDGEQFSTPRGYFAARANAAIDNIKQPPPSIKKYNAKKMGPITQITHPDYNKNQTEWTKWRVTYQSGQKFIDAFLKQFSLRETSADFRLRLDVSPIPAFAKGGINRVKNSIFQRISDVTREGGPKTYQKATNGDLGGVDQQGATMGWFMGEKVLPELLPMKTVGIFVDMPQLPTNATLADKGDKHPYLYIYKVEDIRSWSCYYINQTRIFNAVLLREYTYDVDAQTGLPTTEVERFRHLYINALGFVQVDYYDEYGNILEDQSKTLSIREITFEIAEITESLMKDIANHQICLLNLASSDISYATKSNFPFYTEQYDSRTNNEYLKATAQRSTPDVANSVQPGIITQPNQPEVEVGATQGRRYAIGTERPSFINPSSEPLKASMDKEKQLKDEINELLDLAVQSLAANNKAASADSKAIDEQHLESGLTCIGLELQRVEQRLAYFWCLWEGSKEYPTIKYPRKYRLRSEEDGRKEAEQLAELKETVPSNTFKKEINKKIVKTLIESFVSDDVLQKIYSEIDFAPGTGSAPADIIQDVMNGVVSNKTASVLRGYNASEADAAAKDHADKLARIAEAQSINNPAGDASGRGVKPLESDANASVKEKQGKAQRGEGK